MAKLFEWLRTRSERLDDYLRFRDFYAHRTAGGRLDRWLKINRHTLPALVLPCLICALIVLASPSLERTLIAIGCAIVVGLVTAIFMRHSARRNWPIPVDLVFQCAMVLLVAGIVWISHNNEYQDQHLYRHVFVVVTVLLAIALLVGAILAHFMFRRMHAKSRYGDGLQNRYRDYLRATELFASRGPAPEVTSGTILTSLIMTAFRAPLALLTIPAIVALVSPTAFVWHAFIVALAICFAGLFLAGLNERFGAMWTLMQAVFFKGGALIVSVIVIVLGLARLAGNTYVTPVFDTAAWWTLGITLGFVYVLSWWYDYWSNRLLTDQIMALLEPEAAGRAFIPYNIVRCKVATSVPADGRVLQVHGAGRFLAFSEGPIFQAHTMSSLIDLVTESGAPGGKAVPTAAQVKSRILNFHTVLAIIFVGLLWAEAYHLNQGKQNAEVSVQHSDKGLSVEGLLFDTQRNPDDRTLIIVAASGGGTRAALYTASVLEGIASMGKAKDIVLLSGVSGGGAAEAYFAANREELTSSNKDEREAAWKRYFEMMKQPYIRDVLDRATEWRMAGPGRLGQLLASSFERHWELKNRSKLSEICDVGLIFNTSLAGHVRRPVNAEPGNFADVEPSFRPQTKSTLAGGRLVLTNLKLSELTAKPLEPQDENSRVDNLPIIIRSDDLRLEYAAALNANFPPVFSNAAIDVDDNIRYWVTDGGAVDNRGMEVMLLALRQALKNEKTASLPRLLIVVADASALSDKYSQNRGVSSLAGAGAHFASHLDAEVFSEIENLYKEHSERLRFAYVMMPDRLRESGSFGTQWMLQSWIRVREGDDSDSHSVTIKGEEMIDVLRALHTSSLDKGLHPKPCRVLNWSRADKKHQEEWKKVRQALGGADAEPTCSQN